MGENQTAQTWKGLPLNLLSWFTAGIGLTVGYKFTMWVFVILKLG